MMISAPGIGLAPTPRLLSAAKVDAVRTGKRNTWRKRCIILVFVFVGILPWGRHRSDDRLLRRRQARSDVGLCPRERDCGVAAHGYRPGGPVVPGLSDLAGNFPRRIPGEHFDARRGGCDGRPHRRWVAGGCPEEHFG